MHKQGKWRKYSNTDSSKPGYVLEPGIKGFICTFNNREKECIRESYNILNKYADQLYGTEKPESVSNLQEASESTIEDDLEEELQELKSKSMNIKERRFQVIKSGAKNVLFVRTTIDDTVELASRIVNEIKDTKQPQTRFLIRLIPIELTCRAYVDDIKRACATLLEKYFKDNNKSFSIAYNRRNNGHLDRDEVIKEVADLVIQTPGNHAVNLTAPDVSVVIEIIKGIALLAVVPDYALMKKFNLHAFASSENENTDDKKLVTESKEEKLEKNDKDVTLC